MTRLSSCPQRGHATAYIVFLKPIRLASTLPHPNVHSGQHNSSSPESTLLPSFARHQAVPASKAAKDGQAEDATLIAEPLYQRVRCGCCSTMAGTSATPFATAPSMAAA